MPSSKWSWAQRSMRLPQAGHQRCDVPQVAPVVRRLGPIGAAPIEAARKREKQAQATGGRPEPGQGDVAGRACKKALTPSRKRELATDLMDRYATSMRKACAAIQLSRVVYLYQSVARDITALVMRMKEITQTRVHYGYRRVHVMLKREGFIAAPQAAQAKQGGAATTAQNTGASHQPDLEHGLRGRQPVL